MVDRQVCYYKVLGVDRSATVYQVRSQFRKLVKRCHPDRSSDPKARRDFQKLHKAYKVLTDEQRRFEYDRKRFGRRPDLGVYSYDPVSAQHALHQITKDTHTYQRFSRSVAILSMTFILSVLLLTVLFP